MPKPRLFPCLQDSALIPTPRYNLSMESVDFPVVPMVDCALFFSKRYFFIVRLFIFSLFFSAPSFLEKLLTSALLQASNNLQVHSDLRVVRKRPRWTSTHALVARRLPWSIYMYTCEKCQGSMLLDREVDMESGMSLLVLVCINCGRRKQAERAPLPLIEAS